MSTDVRTLQQTRLFQGLEPPELTAIAHAARQQRVERHTYFFHQGDPATTFYVLTQGQVRLTQITPEGHQILARFIHPGGEFGIVSAFDNMPYPLSAQAVVDSLALAWDSRTMMRLLAQFPPLALNTLHMVTRRFRELQDRYRELATERVERRIARALLRLVRQCGRKVEAGILIDLPLSRQDVADMTGTTLYTVSRVLSRWDQEGLIEAGRERVVVRFPHGLVTIAEDLPSPSPPPDFL